VGFYRPLKAAWRSSQRDMWTRIPIAKLLSKTEFPRMVKEVLEFLKLEQLLLEAEGFQHLYGTGTIIIHITVNNIYWQLIKKR
jgi:hypothetical protein